MKCDIFSMQSFENLRHLKIGAFDLVYFTMACPTSTETNEDSMAFFSNGDSSLVLMVADGAGGHPTGEEASHCLVSTVTEKLEADMKAGLRHIRNSVLDGIEAANQELIDYGTGSKTTATICEISDGQFRAYQIGDSGAMVCGQKGKLKYKTVFHSRAGYGVEAGLLEEEEALKEPDLNEVANILGDRDMAIEIGPPIPLDDKDTILVASDGVYDNFTVSELAEIVRAGSLVEAGKQLIHFFQERLESDPEGLNTKYDDMSFFICRLSSQN